MTRRKFAAGVLCALALQLAGCRSAEPPPPPIAVEISHVVGAEPLELGDNRYEPTAGNGFTVSKLRYYLSNFRLRRADGSWFEPAKSSDSPDGYYLIDEASPESKRFDLLPAPAGEYAGIEFMLGIDVARNHAGAQRGALDPARGMFWTWNTGYIFFKLEGHSSASTAANRLIEYHLGGDTLARRIVLPLAPKPVRVAAGIQPTIHLVVDVGALFTGAQGIRIADTNSVMDEKAGAPIADACAAMFRVDHIHHEPVASAR